MRNVLTVLVGFLLVSLASGCGSEDKALACPPAEPCPSPDTATQEPDPDWIEDRPLRNDSFMGLLPSFEPLTTSGSGNDTVALPEEHWAGIVSASAPEVNHFAVWAADASGVPTNTLVNSPGPYVGTTAFGIDNRQDATSLTVRADGPWTLTISPIEDALKTTMPTSGESDAVFFSLGVEGRAGWEGRVYIDFPADSIAAVNSYWDLGKSETKIDFNPVTEYSTFIPGRRESYPMKIKEGDTIFVVRSAGPWSITLT